jgi:hypothetical protein
VYKTTFSSKTQEPKAKKELVGIGQGADIWGAVDKVVRKVGAVSDLPRGTTKCFF